MLEWRLLVEAKEIDYKHLPQHIAIIMDGNRRWAREKNLDTKLGHKNGADNLDQLVHFANDIGLKYMTVYAFSTENWKRTKEEVGALMILLGNYLDYFSHKAGSENIKINVLGDISRIDVKLQKKIKDAIEKTKDNTGLVLNVAFNYGGRDEIVHAVRKLAQDVKEHKLETEQITEEMIGSNLYTGGQPDPDLLIRTGGELRLSNFLTWQSVYTEFYFSDKYWPDFKQDDLLEAINEFQQRHRRFGAN